MEQNLKEQTIKEKYAYWEWRTLILLMIGYALFYFVRKNFSIVMPALEAELGISKTRLGLFLTMNGIIYGVSRFINGFLADRVSRRKMMATGLLLSAVVNLFIGLTVSSISWMPKAKPRWVWWSSSGRCGSSTDTPRAWGIRPAAL